MKIIYDDRHEEYIVKLEYPETDILISADNIVQARERFIECMMGLFNNAVNKKFINQEKEN